MKTYRYTTQGCDVDGKVWEAKGVLRCEINAAMDAALKDTFRQLTNGNAVYGMPGVGCNGPYDIQRVVIEQVKM